MAELAGVRCLFVSYNSLTSALVHSQVLPYLRGLAELGARFTLLTFEPPEQPRPSRAFVDELRARGIAWRHLRYHRRPTLPATLFDVTAGIGVGAVLAARSQLNVVHARGYPPAMIARGLKAARGLPFIFDMRGLMADEYADIGHWQRTSLAYRLTKRAEADLLRHADAVVVLTNRVRKVLWPRGERPMVSTIPCCVDLATYHWPAERDPSLIAALGLTGKHVLVNSGSVGTWYMLDDILRFAAQRHALDPASHLLMLNVGEHALIRSRIAALGIEPSTVTLAAVSPDVMPKYLALADAGICFVRPSFSKLASSPTKVGEYLATGLPIVGTAGVGDLDTLLDGKGVGILLRGESDSDLAAAAAALGHTLQLASIQAHCRSVAENELSLARGVSAYAEIYARLGLRRSRSPQSG